MCAILCHPLFASGHLQHRVPLRCIGLTALGLSKQTVLECRRAPAPAEPERSSCWDSATAINNSFQNPNLDKLPFRFLVQNSGQRGTFLGSSILPLKAAGAAGLLPPHPTQQAHFGSLLRSPRRSQVPRAQQHSRMKAHFTIDDGKSPISHCWDSVCSPRETRGVGVAKSLCPVKG